MIKLKSLIISYVLPILAVAAVASIVGFAKPQKSGSNQLCNHQYALCTSAPCIPQPGDPSKAICFCDVKEGPNLSTVPCNTLIPSTDANGIRTVYSTFSFDQYTEGKKGMKCPGDTPWTSCLNKRCTVDPADPSKAICTCDVMRSGGEWTTLGGNCDTATCKTGYWSGAAMSGHDDAVQFLQKALGLQKSPVKWCQAN